MADERHRTDDSDEAEEPRPGTFSGESRGSGANTASGLGRGGDVIVQDDIVYGRPLSGRDRAEGDRAPDQDAAQADGGAEPESQEKGSDG